MRRVRLLIAKEWADMFKTRIVKLTMTLTPLLFVLIAIASIYPTSMIEAEAQMNAQGAEFAQFAGDLCDGMSGASCVQAYMGVIMSLMFMMLPSLLPGVFAAYSVVGEKADGTLEPLLATPITTTELILGKALAALIPSLVLTWLAFAAYLGAAASLLRPDAFAALVAPHWIVAILITGPLLGWVSVLSAMLVSARVDDARTAQQISGLVIMPVLMLLIGQSIGQVVVSPGIVFGGSLALAAVAALLFWATVQGFAREAILARRG